MIKNIVHFFWSSGQIPEKYQECINSWKQFHPVRIWTPDELGIDKSLSCNFQSDIAKGMLAYENGGIIADCDVYCLRSFEPLLRTESFAIKTGFSVKIMNCLFGSTKSNPLANELLETTLKILPNIRPVELCYKHSDILSKCKVIHSKTVCPIIIGNSLSCSDKEAYAIHKHFLGWKEQ